MEDMMNARIKRIYVDMTVVYGAPTKKFSYDSKCFWDAFRRGEFMIIVSDVLEDELKRAPEHIRASFNSIPESQIERVFSTPESNALAAQYIAENVVGKSSLDDCRHIALATISRADAIVSWNFGHIVDRQGDYNSVNEKLGYPRIEIQTPNQREATNDET
jgi:hypothetical protein